MLDFLLGPAWNADVVYPSMVVNEARCSRSATTTRSRSADCGCRT
jgi:hypothetical protein